MPPYSYQSVTGSRGIRLLSLSKGTSLPSWDSPIKCSLATYDLVDDKRPKYATLSYAWGASSRIVPIFVDGAELLVTPFLEEALKQIREHYHNGALLTGWWWIDMICINQDDVDERGQQVAIMRDIFQQSIETMAWLGPADDTSDQAFESLRLRSKKFDDAGLIPLISLFGRAYWRRLWVIQEICVSANLYLACGKRVIPWTSEFGLYISRFLVCDAKINWPHGEIHFASQLAKLRRNFQGPGSSKLTIGMLTEGTDLSRCADFRDHVYGLLGLVKHGCGGTIIPDYSKSPCSVFSTAFRAMFEDLTDPRLGHNPHASIIKEAKERANRGPHNPFSKDDSGRNGCGGLDCGTYRQYLRLADSARWVDAATGPADDRLYGDILRKQKSTGEDVHAEYN